MLVTGSLHLIGGILNLIEPDLWKRKRSEEEICQERKLVESYNEIQNEKISDKNEAVKFCKRS